MDNITALRGLVNAIASTFHPDEDTLRVALYNEGITADGVAYQKDERLFRIAVALVKGYIEASRSDNGISASVNVDGIERSLKHWCGVWGIDAGDVMRDGVIIEDGTQRW